jgi:hypothetical protein
MLWVLVQFAWCFGWDGNVSFVVCKLNGAFNGFLIG